MTEHPPAADPAALRRKALEAIKLSRWTEAKRTLDELAEAAPGYQDTDQLRTLVDEVIPIARYGFAPPSHIPQRAPEPAFEPEDEPGAELWTTPKRSTFPTAWVIAALALIAAGALAFWFFVR